jgi:hypothetical protein
VLAEDEGEGGKMVADEDDTRSRGQVLTVVDHDAWLTAAT